MRISFLLMVGCAVGMAAACDAAMQVQQHQLGKAFAKVTDQSLEISTGVMSRKWQWTATGWSTNSIRDVAHEVEYGQSTGHGCDWSLPGKLDDQSAAVLADCVITESDDDGFSSKHLEILSTVNYPHAGLSVQHVVWVYPGVSGVRTQLRIKSMPGYNPLGAMTDDQTYLDCGGTRMRPGAGCEWLPLDFTQPNSRRYWGIFNDPGNRLDQSKPMLEEKVISGYPLFQPEVISWANGEAVDFGGRGVMVVKESPKAVNQPAHLTGGFFSGPHGLQVTGWGLAPNEIVNDRYRECWATWTMVYNGGNDGMQMALKQFDAARYPVFPERDAIILSNTWGPANPSGSAFTEEAMVMKEIPALAEIGVDVMQIDDGWQKSGGGPGASQFRPKYAHGWRDIKSLADQYQMRIGLWVAIRNAKLDELKQDVDELGFVSWKADFDHLSNRGDYEDRIAKYRAVLKHAWMKTQFTLCPEYNDPRYGWYFAREYGSIYFQNIQEGLPSHLTFVPYQVLRQHWLMAKYIPSNKLQVMLQNPKRTRKDLSDASQHGHGYCFAMGLPFVPCFFQLAQNLADDETRELAVLIAAYKHHRNEIFTSTTYPIGFEPNNASWTGFQMVSSSRNGSGYFLIFRELHNGNAKAVVPLKFLAGKSLDLTNLITGETQEVSVSGDGTAEFTIPTPADYRFYHYRIR